MYHPEADAPYFSDSPAVANGYRYAIRISWQDTQVQTWPLYTLHVEYAEQRTKYGILFIFSLFHEYMNLEYVRIHVICRVNQAEYASRIPMAAPQEYVNTYSTRRLYTLRT